MAPTPPTSSSRATPRAGWPDSTLPLLADPYGFIAGQARRLGSDVVAGRLLGAPTLFLTGAEAARLFYDEDLFVRAGAAPRRVQKTLFGVGGVQGLDGAAHRHRKQLFLSLMTPERLRQLVELTEAGWRQRIGRWQSAEQVTLLEEVSQLLCRAVCDWAGVPLAERDLPRRAAQLTAMIEAPAAVGARYWQGRLARRAAERWARETIGRLRAAAVDAGVEAEETPARVIAWHRDAEGALLEPRVAAVELLNVLRPTVAISRFVVFAAVALHSQPRWRDELRSSEDPRFVERFVHEVRRFYPFFPVVAGRARRDFDWRGHHVRAGQRVLLDLHGTNHDPRSWDRPEQFQPDRFRTWDGDAYSFVPQGGGDHLGHRCAGEWITIELMKVAVIALTRWMTYAVPPQDLRIPARRVPAAPNSRLLISQVEPTAAPDEGSP